MNYQCRFVALWIILMSFSIASVAAQSEAKTFWNEHAVGWHWYHDPIILKKITNTKRSEKLPENSDPVAVMEALQKEVKRSLYRAILEPTKENLQAYIVLQNYVSNQARQFSDTWQATLLSQPNLDFSLIHPTNAIGKQIYLDQERENENRAIALLAQNSGLFFFYHSTCPYCQKFSPILKQFSDHYGISVVPITTDGISLPEFPNSRIDEGQAAQLNIDRSPAVFVVNPYTQKMVAVGYGLMTQDELRQRILRIAQYFQQERGQN